MGPGGESGLGQTLGVGLYSGVRGKLWDRGELLGGVTSKARMDSMVGADSGPGVDPGQLTLWKVKI